MPTGTLRLALSQLLHIRLQVDGLVTKFLKEVPGGDPTPTKASYLSRQEVLETARVFETLTRTHDYEAELRAWEREKGQAEGQGAAEEQAGAAGGDFRMSARLKIALKSVIEDQVDLFIIHRFDTAKGAQVRSLEYQDGARAC